MPRRPLFCPTCTELLDQLDKAAEAVCHETFAPRGKGLDSDSRTQIELRIHYLKIKERATEHLDKHVHSRNADPISCLRLIA